MEDPERFPASLITLLPPPDPLRLFSRHTEACHTAPSALYTTNPAIARHQVTIIIPHSHTDMDALSYMKYTANSAPLVVVRGGKMKLYKHRIGWLFLNSRPPQPRYHRPLRSLSAATGSRDPAPETLSV